MDVGVRVVVFDGEVVEDPVEEVESAVEEVELAVAEDELGVDRVVEGRWDFVEGADTLMVVGATVEFTVTVRAVPELPEQPHRKMAAAASAAGNSFFNV